MKWVFILGTVLTVYSFIVTKFFLTERYERIEAERIAEALEAEFDRWKENDIQNQKNAEKLETASKEDKSNFNWNHNIYASPVIKQLRKSCKSCSDAAD